MNVFLAGSLVRFKFTHTLGGTMGEVIKDTRYKSKIVVKLKATGCLVVTDPEWLLLIRGPKGKKDKDDAARKIGHLVRSLMGEQE